MSLKYAMLGFLSIQSMNGYQLKQHFDESISRFWNASISQIYPTLNDMLKSDLIAIENNSSEAARKSIIYCITQKGKDELQQWLMNPSKEEAFRSEMLVKLYFSAKIEPKTVIENLLILKNETFERIKFYESCIAHIERDHTAEQSYKSDAVYWRMTIRYGLVRDRALIDWYDECIEILTSKGKNESVQKL